jgi:LysM domain
MKSMSLSKILFATAVSSASMMMVSSAFAAGRCGGVYAVDKATTLTSVAQRCNVNLSALYEANPGVDPNDVHPGARLALPSEITSYATGNVSSTPNSLDSDTSHSTHSSNAAHDYVAPVTDDDGMNSINLRRGDNALLAHRVRVRDMRVSGASPLWLQPETDGGRYSNDGQLSYQKQSAMRIHNTSVQFPQPAVINTPTASTPKTKLIECPVLRSSDGGKIHQVRSIISTPENTFVEIIDSADGSGFDCTLIPASVVEEKATENGVLPAKFTSSKLSPPVYHLPDYNRIGITPRAVKINQTFSLKGKVTDSYKDCLLLLTSDNRLWRLASPQPSTDLIGKKVTVWGKAGTGGTCGGGATMVVSHAVYGEPWAKN